MTESKEFTLQEAAEFLGAELVGEGRTQFRGIATLQNAGETDLSFLANPAYAKYLPDTRAAAVILAPDQASQCPVAALVMDNPYLGYAKISHWFDQSLPSMSSGISEQATVDPGARVASTAVVEAGAVIQAGAEIGERCYIGPNSVIGRDSRIGSDTRLYAGVRIYHGVTIGERCIIHSGAVIGSDGFGIAPVQSEDGASWSKIAQIGGVIVGNDVEIGANTCIDRGALDNTEIADGVKLDNLIQIAHNVRIGKNTAIAACVGIAGSTTIGQNCIFGGGVGIGGHLDITDNVHLTGMAMVTKSIGEPGVYSSGTGLEPNRKWHKTIARMRRLDEMAKKIKALEKSIQKD